MCAAWAGSFDVFFVAMGVRPNGTTLGRIDNAKGYEPGNCRWETASQQGRNTTRTRWIEANGERLPLPTWAERLGITPHALRHRIKKWGDPVRAVTAPKTEPKL